ncbi:FtsX-like permease family protein [Pseudomaricurvus alcaniphilus]|uniref:ABC transporter permease n=1 Tax=Pseudomaricurvus alcaniphilus TaxID=1166482 RepID=UPI00140B357D|nr:ABC transporter permease [Pseudomaricurvus alcaniphilus]NHN36981.1 FtsX-like permease family protein [Pseudomaricurvus alcaniphilus]
MGERDSLLFCWQSITRYRFRSAMILLAIGFGVAAVVVLTALGEGARRYVLQEFAFLGKDVLVMFPGRNETTGGLPPVTGAAARDITLADVAVLGRRVSGLQQSAPLVLGSAAVSFQQRSREVIVLGTSAAFVTVRKLKLARGRNLQLEDIERASVECLIGQTLERELLQGEAALGALLRVADYRCRVVGVLQGRGDAFGMDLGDSLILSVAAAQRLFNTAGLFRVIMQVREGYDPEQVKQQVIDVITALHQGENDVTVVSPDALLSTFDDILTAMTLGVGAIGGISLLVAGILIMNITVISVGQRTEEIGLLKALGADDRLIRKLFVLEAVLLSVCGAVLGSLAGLLLLLLGRQLLPQVDFAVPLWALFGAGGVAVGCGFLFSWVPATRASKLLPLNALQRR